MSRLQFQQSDEFLIAMVFVFIIIGVMWFFFKSARSILTNFCSFVFYIDIDIDIKYVTYIHIIHMNISKTLTRGFD